MITVQPVRQLSARVLVPGSKSYTHRFFIAAALSDGICRIGNALRSEDTDLTLQALGRMGVPVSREGDGTIITGTGGKLKAAGELCLDNCGTGMRLLTAVAALTDGRTVLTGNERMKERPISDLIDGLAALGVSVRSLDGTGCPPVEVIGGNLEGGRIPLRCEVSSQYLSAILLIAPFSTGGITVTLEGEVVSKPYIDLTLDVMDRFGISLDRRGYAEFHVPGQQTYRAGDYVIEPDASNASYFWAAAAVTGGSVTVGGITAESRQGDMGILRFLSEMGCEVSDVGDGITVSGRRLKGIDAEMGDMPDMVPTLAVVAAFAEGTTVIRNIAHLKKKESDRMAAVAAELGKMGIHTRCTENSMEIVGGSPRSADIETYNDHRIAMAFSIAGLKIPGVRIMNENCVVKSFPGYWDVFHSLYSR